MIEVGFTGTRRGMIMPQRFGFKDLVKTLLMDKFHHGDCVGSDAQAHDFVAELRNTWYVTKS